MARVLGDTLIVNRSHKPGEEQIVNLVELFNANPNRIIVVAGTVGADGAPNTGRVSLELFQEGDLVIGIQGTMRVIKEPMAFSDAMALWEMQVQKVKLDTSPAQRVLQGPASTPRNEKAEAFEKAGIAELLAEAQKG
jgi:hypothetical protein